MAGFKSIGRAIARTLAPPTGTSRIEKAIGQFEAIANEIDAGVAANAEQISQNEVEIYELEQQNRELAAANLRGSNFAGKLRDLIS